MTEGSNERDILLTLFDLGRQVASVIELDELLQRIPELIGRLIQFDAFAVYLLDERRRELRIALRGRLSRTSSTSGSRLQEGLIGRVVSAQQAVVVGDVAGDPHYIEVVPGMASTLAVPLVHKAKSIGALNILSRERDHYSERDAGILRQFATLVAAAIVNARLFEQQRQDAEAFETLAEIGREVAAVLDLDELLSRIAQLTRRLVDYRTFGILLLNEQTQELEIEVAVKYGEKVHAAEVPLGEGLVGLCGAASRSGARARRVEGPALHQGGRRRAIRAGGADAPEGSVHRRVRSRKPGARRVHEARRRDPDAAGQPGGGRHRERAALRGSVADRSAAGEGACASRNACRPRCCRRSCRSG